MILKKLKLISCIKLIIPAVVVTTTVKQSTMSYLFTCRVNGIPIFIFNPWDGYPIYPSMYTNWEFGFFSSSSNLVLPGSLKGINLAFHLNLYNEATLCWQNLAKLGSFCWREYRNYNEVRAGMYKALCQDVFTTFIQTVLAYAQNGSVSFSASMMPKYSHIF